VAYERVKPTYVFKHVLPSSESNMNINSMDMFWLFHLEAADTKEDGDNGNTAQWRKFHQPNTGSTTAQNCRGSLKFPIVLE
jgi:hypothetical protein